MTGRVIRWGLLAAMLIQGVPVYGQVIDEARSHFGFEVRTRIGQRIEGVFPRFEAAVEALPDGRHQVRIRLFTRQVEIPGRESHTRWARSDSFFDAARFPLIEFASEPYNPELLKAGGNLDGVLTIRGISHEERLRVADPACGRPAVDCDAVVRGSIRRARYDMDNWQWALGDRVTFLLRVRLKDEGAN